MKFLLILTFFFSLSTFANPIIIDIGGVRHQCTPVSQGNPLECFNAAYSGPFNRSEALDLCSGSISDAPAKCAISAYSGRYSRIQSIELCKVATTNTGPVDCANLAYSGPFTSDESIELCSRNGSERNAVCALDAYRGPFTKEQAISMCKNPRLANDNSLMILKKNLKFSKDDLNDLLDEANQKAINLKEYKR